MDTNPITQQDIVDALDYLIHAVGWAIGVGYGESEETEFATAARHVVGVHQGQTPSDQRGQDQHQDDRRNRVGLVRVLAHRVSSKGCVRQFTITQPAGR